MIEFKKGDRVKCGKLVGVADHVFSDKTLNVRFDGSTENPWTMHPDMLELVERPKEKKLVPHWPAVISDTEGNYEQSLNLFPSIEAAFDWFKTYGAYCFVHRLATELPPIMIEVEE